MNHQIPPFNQNVPIISHTDWGSMAKQWATLRANLNIPPTVNKTESYVYHNIPPPPPPPPTLPKSNASYNCDYQDQSYNSNMYEHPPMPSMIYDDVMVSKNNSQCETFDYNHRDRPYVNYNNIHQSYRPIAPQVPHNNSAPFSQNIFNLPPPTHQDYIETPKTSFVPELMTIPAPPKLFPICNVDQYDGIVKNHSQSSMLISSGNPAITMKQSMAPLFVGHKFPNPTDFSTNRSNKGLPAWIIDDMKKIKEKERKQPFTNSSDDFRDHPVNSKRDEEGDIVMEDVIKDSENDAAISGKSVITTNRIDILTTDIDIDDVNLNDEDDGFDKIDYSSKSLIDLIEMLDESELDNLKIVIIRDSLTAVMKQVTNDMISEVVRSTFTNELSKSTSKSKVGSAPRPSKTVNCINGATVKSVDPPTIDLQMEHSCHLLGLGVYESDEEDGGGNAEPKIADSTDIIPAKSESRDQWSTHKRSSETTKAVDKKSSHDKDSHKLPSNEKKKSSSDTNSNRNSSPKRKKRSKSRDLVHKRSRSRERHRSPDYRRRSRSKDRRDGGGSSTHKKPKRHNHSPESRSLKWKNDKCDTNNNSSSKKRNKRDRSRS